MTDTDAQATQAPAFPTPDPSLFGSPLPYR
jgi:hypothetical protein